MSGEDSAQSSPKGDAPFRRVGRKLAFDGKIVHVSVDTVEVPDGRSVDLEVVHHQGATAIVPLLDDSSVLMVRQYRYAPGEWLLEVPAGKLDPGEAPAACAARELEEEVGYRADDLTAMGWIWTTPGFTNEKIHLYLARSLRKTEQRLEPEELLTVESIPFGEAIEMARDGSIRDAKTICALFRAERLLGSPS